MKKLLIGLLSLLSISAFAENIKYLEGRIQSKTNIIGFKHEILLECQKEDCSVVKFIQKTTHSTGTYTEEINKHSFRFLPKEMKKNANKYFRNNIRSFNDYDFLYLPFDFAYFGGDFGGVVGASIGLGIDLITMPIMLIEYPVEFLIKWRGPHRALNRLFNNKTTVLGDSSYDYCYRLIQNLPQNISVNN